MADYKDNNNEWIEKSMPAISRMAEDLADDTMDYEDLLQEGYLGAMHGIAMRFDESAAWSGLTLDEIVLACARRAMEDAKIRISGERRSDLRILAQMEQLLASIDRLTEELGTKPNIDEIANDMGIPQESVLRLLKLTGEEFDEEAVMRNQSEGSAGAEPAEEAP